MKDLNDGELLEAFRFRSDEGAFAELMRRHSRTVLAAARTALGDGNAAEDVAQATFLALAKHAHSIEGMGSIAGWLYRVAVNLAHNVRRDELRRAAKEKEAAALKMESESTFPFPEHAFVALSEEIANLAERYRTPIILHHIEGRSYEDAAAALGCKLHTFGSRLTRGREQLQERLTKRGVALGGAAALVAALGQSASAAELPAGFVASTCAAAGGGAVSAKVAALMESALEMLFWAKVKTVAAICAVAVLVGGAGVGLAVTLPLVLKPAATTAPKAETPSAEDAWIRELLVRAEGGSWDALDLKRGSILGGSGVWRTDLRGEPAGWRVWQTNPEGESMAFLDEARWKRGVLVGRVMLLPAGTLPSTLAIPEQASNAVWKTKAEEIIGVDGKAGPTPKGVFLTLYKNSDYVSVLGSLDADTHPRGVWHRFAVYFDVDAKGGAFVAWKTWPEDLTGPPPATQWSSGRKTYAHLTGNMIGLGLRANDVPVLWQGLKLVPLGTDLPPPPPGVGAGSGE